MVRGSFPGVGSSVARGSRQTWSALSSTSVKAAGDAGRRGFVRFWDSSAVIPLLIGQAASARVDEWLEADPSVAVWTLTPVEISSAIRRLVREGRLDDAEADAAEARADELVATSHLVLDVDGVKAQARRLLRLHPMRAADALQLGAAVEWAHGRATGRFFCTLDAQLARAAAREGFRVLSAAAE